jgi:hypothetical protein
MRMRLSMSGSEGTGSRGIAHAVANSSDSEGMGTIAVEGLNRSVVSGAEYLLELVASGRRRAFSRAFI